MLAGSLDGTVDRGDSALETPGLLPQALELVQPLCKATETNGHARAGQGPARCSSLRWSINLGVATDPPVGWELLREGMGCSWNLAVAPSDARNMKQSSGGSTRRAAQ